MQVTNHFNWSTSDQTCFENTPNYFIKQNLLPFSNKNENVHPKYHNLLQINTDIISQLVFVPNMITRANPVKRPIDHNTDEIRSNP